MGGTTTCDVKHNMAALDNVKKIQRDYFILFYFLNMGEMRDLLSLCVEASLKGVRKWLGASRS